MIQPRDKPSVTSDTEPTQKGLIALKKATPSNALALQRTIGNQNTTRLVQSDSATDHINNQPKTETRNVAGTGAQKRPASTHTSKPSHIQRDLLTYRRTWRSPGGPGDKEISASAGIIYNDLEPLIKEKKVNQKQDGNKVYFSNISATRKELVEAFQYYPKAAEMSDALLDHHNVSLYSHHKIYTQWYGGAGFKDYEYNNILDKQRSRPLTPFERAEAQLVFANSVDYNAITLNDQSILSIGATARAFPNSIHFEPGSFDEPGFMELLIHELTHSWQYQRGIGMIAHLPDAIAGIYDYGGEAGLVATSKAGKKFRDFNLEQQGDIMEHYYARLRAGLDVCAWLPFVYEVQGIQSASPDNCLEIPVKIPVPPRHEFVVGTYKIPQFDINSDEIPVSGETILSQVAADLAANPDSKVVVEGFADSTGDFIYNLSLSHRRADSIRQALKDDFGIDPARVQTEGRGEVPLPKNWDKEKYRAHNRRVEITVIGQKS